MLTLMLLFGLLSVVCAAAAAIALLLGFVLAFIPSLRRLAPLVALPVPLAAIGAVLASWGLANGINAVFGVSAGILSFWAWPVGFLVGGLAGLGLGTILAAFLALGRPRAIPHD